MIILIFLVGYNYKNIYVMIQKQFYQVQICNSSWYFIKKIFMWNRQSLNVFEDIPPGKCSEYKKSFQMGYFEYQLYLQHDGKILYLSKKSLDQFDKQKLSFWKNTIDISHITFHPTSPIFWVGNAQILYEQK